MKTGTIQSIAGAVDTLPLTTDPMYQNAVLSLMLRKTLENFKTNGIIVTRPEVSDFTSFDSDMNTFLANANTRLDELLRDGVTSVVANLPDVIAVGEAFVSGGGTAVGGLILNRILGHLFHNQDSRAEHEGARENVDTAQIEAHLLAIKENLENDAAKSIGQLLDETIGAVSGQLGFINDKMVNSTGEVLAQILEDALMTTNVSAERYALMWALIRQAIRIIVQKDGEYSDVSQEDSS